MNTKIPLEIVNSLNEILQESAPEAVIEVMRQQVGELSQVVQNDWFVTDNLRGLVMICKRNLMLLLPWKYLSQHHLLVILPLNCQSEFLCVRNYEERD